MLKAEKQMTEIEKIRSNTAGRTYEEVSPVRRKNAVLIPLIEEDGELCILFEVRQAGIRQGGEICFPGGMIEDGETVEEAAVRETAEELLIPRGKIEVIAPMHTMSGPGGARISSCLGILHDYKGTWSRAEVDRVFTQPLDWILANDPDIYRINLERKMPEDFPYDHVPGGRDYRWREQFYSVPFYPQVQTELSLFEVPEEQTVPALWGVTARVTNSLAVLLREGGNSK